ncbi:hypothetical protein ACUY26_06840 [Corynebacterium segmentosum]
MDKLSTVANSLYTFGESLYKAFEPFLNIADAASKLLGMFQ